MAVRLMADVFRHVHGMPSGRRMLLLVLADFANADGVCWPSIKSLAANADLGERHVSGELKQLVKDGYLTIEEHAGKSHHYRICIPEGVNHSSGVNRSASRTTVQGGDEPQATTGDEPQATPPLNHSSPPLRLTTNEPPVLTTNEPPVSASAPKKAMPANGPVQGIVKAWYERAGFDPANYGKALGFAKQLHAANVGPGELGELYDWFAASPFWQEKGFDLGTCVSQLEKFRQAKRTPKTAGNGRASPGKLSNYEISAANIMAGSEPGDVFETTGRTIR